MFLTRGFLPCVCVCWALISLSSAQPLFSQESDNNRCADWNRDTRVGRGWVNKSYCQVARPLLWKVNPRRIPTEKRRFNFINFFLGRLASAPGHCAAVIPKICLGRYLCSTVLCFKVSDSFSQEMSKWRFSTCLFYFRFYLYWFAGVSFGYLLSYFSQ